MVGLHDRPDPPRPSRGRTLPHNVAAEPGSGAAATRRPAPRGPPHAAAPATIPRAAAPTPPHPRRRAAAARAAGAALPSPRRFVRDYYAALHARRFAAAWKLLGPRRSGRFGGFEAWRSGFKYTVASSPGSLRVTAAAGAATVGLTLRAGDRDACGKTVERRFAVSWRLARTEAGWRATAARRASSPAPALPPLADQ